MLTGCRGEAPAVTETAPQPAAASPAPAQDPAAAARQALIARAKTFELDTPYVPPPGDPLVHHASGFAKVICSAVFITGLDADFAVENVGHFVAPPAARAELGKPVVDRARKSVKVTVPGGVDARGALSRRSGLRDAAGRERCRQFHAGRREDVASGGLDSALADGRRPGRGALPPGLDPALLEQAVDAAFEPATGLTAAFVVTWKGRLVAERYGDGIRLDTPLESWSMGKSLTATLLALLIKDGVYRLDQPAPIPEWQTPGDPRADDPDRGPAAHVERTAHIGRRRIRTSMPAGPIPITSISTPAASTRFTTRRHGRCSGRPTPWAATTTAIRCSSTI